MTAPAASWRDVPMSSRLRALPQDARGFPVPFFVHWEGAVPHFEIVATPRLVRCVADKLCWICGQRLGKVMAFVLGPMCVINRISSEPPSHLDCARYAVQVCPFLVRPAMRRQPPGDVPRAKPAGFMDPRNPGVAALWVTRRYEVIRGPESNAGRLFRVGEPLAVTWWREGRRATSAEALDGFENGAARLRDRAAEWGDDLAYFDGETTRARALLPAEPQP